MRLIQLDELEMALDIAIVGRLCIQTWLGHAQVLFIGFGEEVLPSMPPTARHPRPPYELQTNFADWYVEDESGVIGTADDKHAKMKATVHRLVGHKAISWRFIGSSLGLEIKFSGGLKLMITPMVDPVEDMSHKEAWNLYIPDNYYRQVRWDGTMFMLHKDEPCTSEPD